MSMKRIDETTKLIADELRTLLDRKNTDSHMSRRMREACPTYEKLTISEHLFALGVALGTVQEEVAGDLNSPRPEKPAGDDEKAA